LILLILDKGVVFLNCGFCCCQELLGAFLILLILDKGVVLVCRFVSLVGLRTFISIGVVGTRDDSVVDDSSSFVFFKTLFLRQEQELNGVRICAGENGSDETVIVFRKSRPSRIASTWTSVEIGDPIAVWVSTIFLISRR